MAGDPTVITSPRRTITVRGTLKEFGKEWRLVRPNQLVANAVMGGDDGQVDISFLNRYFSNHVHPEERADFLRAAMDDPTMELEQLTALMERMSEVVYGDLPGEPT